MAVAELFIGAFITVLFEKLATGDLIRLAQSAGIDSELEKWRNTLMQIQAVLVDAGEKHVKIKSVQIWLNNLQHLAYEIDDVLDDLATEAGRRRLSRESSPSTSKNTSKVLKFIPNKLHDIKYGHKMRSKLDGVTTKLDDLIKQKNLLGLVVNAESSNRVSSRRLEATSLVNESEIIGREDEKEALLRKLLDGESSSSSSQTKNFKVVSIVGLGGIGKTTLAQLLYNDEEVKKHFEVTAWVCVSDEFDVFNISKSILQAVGGGSQDFANLDLLQRALSEKLSNKKFLLVLDDVWNEKYNEWECLQRPFNVVSSGSKVVVTTRKTKVASVMDSVQMYSLELLSDKDALSLFARHALGEQNFDVNHILKLHGEDIVKKCGRLPLALRTLGRVFRTKSTYEEWEKLLNSEVWNLDNDGEIPTALMLSYYDLPSHLKQIFAYCCLFPKDYEFKKDELVLLWMAEGFLDHPNGDKTMEDLGDEYFKELVSRSFFQNSTDRFKSSLYTMHDLLNDLAMSVGGELFFVLDAKADNTLEASEKVYHFSLIHKDYLIHKKKLESLQRAIRLRTLLTLPVAGSYSVFNVLSSNIVIEVTHQLQFLRVLSLAHFDIEEVPQFIGSLKHLRYLNLSHTRIRCLPEEVGNLHNLQSLLLSGCEYLSSLPNSMKKLVNLRHLDIVDTIRLDKMPFGLGGLTALQTLSKVIIEKDGECRISDLKGLVHLRGQLSIEGLHEVKDAIQAKDANLHQKKGIHDLRLKWSEVFDDSRNGTTEYKVLEGLRPFEKLVRLEIEYYSGTKFPGWVGDPTFDCLTTLRLHGCKSCTCLLTLGQLPSLQTLIVRKMDRLKRLGSEFFRPSNSCHQRVAFPSLVVLTFEDMVSWEEWSTSDGDKAEAFPIVREISIINCPKLNLVAIELMPTLQVLKVKGCSLAVLSSMICASSSIAELKVSNIKGLMKFDGEVLEHLKAVEDLSISYCNEISYLWESEAAACEILVNLRRLYLRKCASLVSTGEKDVNRAICMKSLTQVEIDDCPSLESYSYPNSIENLRIEYCPSITSLTFPTTDDLPSTLKHLTISHCGNMGASWLVNNFLSSLKCLYINRMPNLKLFPEGCLMYLTTLRIWYCDNIEYIPDNGYGFLPSLCLRELDIEGCKNLKSFPHKHLQSLTSLEEMEIINCPSMDYSFPCGLWPPNLSHLTIGCLKKPISEWGVQNFPTSLVTLRLFGQRSGVVSFAKAEEDTSSSSMLTLPSSLTSLTLLDFMELESLSEGLQHLTCLDELHISNCPKLKDLPETLLPSLSCLRVHGCDPKLYKKCHSTRKGKGYYRNIICKIPHLYVEQE